MKSLRLNKAHLTLLIFFQLTIFVFLLSVFLLVDFSPDVYKYILVVVFVECVALSFIDKVDSIYQIFLFMMLVFNIALPILEIFDLYSYPTGNRIMISDGIKTVVSDKTLAETYQVLITMIIGASVGWLIGKYNFDRKNKQHDGFISGAVLSIRYRNNIKFAFFVIAALVIYRNSLLAYYATLYGYIDVMHLHSNNLEISGFFSLADILFKVSGFAVLFQSRNDKEYIKYATLFMFPFFIQAAAGARGETITMLITVMFIYSQFFNKLKLKKIILVAVTLFLTSIFLGALRFSSDISAVFFDISILNLVLYGIVSNASSMGVIAYTIELKDQFFNSVPFLFGYIQGIFSLAPNYTYEGIQNKSYLAQHLIYVAAPAKLDRGSTVGTAMGAEFYEFAGGSMAVIFILSVLLLYFAKYFISRLNRNVIMFYLGALYFETLLLSPRGSIMKIFNKESLITMAVLISFAILFKLIKRTKSKAL